MLQKNPVASLNKLHKSRMPAYKVCSFTKGQNDTFYPIFTDFHRWRIDPITLIRRCLFLMSLSICRHMTYSSSSPFRPPSNRKVRLLPRDLYACVTRHGDIHEIEEKLRERKAEGKKRENGFCVRFRRRRRQPSSPLAGVESEKLLRRRASRQISWHGEREVKDG